MNLPRIVARIVAAIQSRDGSGCNNIVSQRDQTGVIRKTPGKGYCVKSEHNPDWSGGCYPTMGEAKKRLEQVEAIKHVKSSRIVSSIKDDYALVRNDVNGYKLKLEGHLFNDANGADQSITEIDPRQIMSVGSNKSEDGFDIILIHTSHSGGKYGNDYVQYQYPLDRTMLESGHLVKIIKSGIDYDVEQNETMVLVDDGMNGDLILIPDGSLVQASDDQSLMVMLDKYQESPDHLGYKLPNEFIKDIMK